MEHSLDFIRLNCLANGGGISDVRLNEWPPTHEVFVSGREIVQGNGEVTRFAQCFAGMGTDVTSSTGDEDGTMTQCSEPLLWFSGMF
jgi:hypothetical protein